MLLHTDRLDNMGSNLDLGFVSIHAPAWGATNLKSRFDRHLTPIGRESRLLVPYPVAMGIPMMGHRTFTAKAVTIIRMMLAGIPHMKNSPVVNCLES